MLRRYLELARARGREDAVEGAVLGEEDYRLLRRLVEEAGGRVSAEELLEALAERLVERVDPEIAREALREAGVPADEETARRIIARLLAAWLLEAGDYWGFVRLS